MQLIQVLQLALLASFPNALAVPVAESDSSIQNITELLIKRADPAPVSCGPSSNQRAWPLQSVQNSYQGLVDNSNKPNNQKPAAGTRVYPRQYGSNSGLPTDPSVVAALNAIPECITGRPDFKYFEFPLLDPVFETGPAMSQGPDRVVAISPKVGQGETRTFTYCLAMTHRGGNGGAFFPCTNSP